MSIFSKLKDTVSKAITSVKAGGVANPNQIDTELESRLKERGIIGMQGEAIVNPEAVKQKVVATKSGIDPITNLKKGISVVKPLPFKDSKVSEVPKGQPYTTSIIEPQKITPFSAAKTVIDKQLGYGKTKNNVSSIPVVEKVKEKIPEAIKYGTKKILESTNPLIQIGLKTKVGEDVYNKIYDSSAENAVEYGKKFIKNPAQTSVEIISAPFKWTVGDPMNFIDSSIKEITNSDLVQKAPKTKAGEL